MSAVLDVFLFFRAVSAAAFFDDFWASGSGHGSSLPPSWVRRTNGIFLKSPTQDVAGPGAGGVGGRDEGEAAALLDERLSPAGASTADETERSTSGSVIKLSSSAAVATASL